MVAINSALAWKLIIADDTIMRAADALEKLSQAETQLAEARTAYESTLRLFAVACDDDYQLPSECGTDHVGVPLTHEGQVLLSLVCHRAAMEAASKYGFDVKSAFEYGFREWAVSEEGRRFIRYAKRKLKYRQ